MKIDAKNIYYKNLNGQIKQAVKDGSKEIKLVNVNGQRYIGDGIREKVSISIDGVPGNDLGAFMEGPVITINNNVQDCVGNTMNSGKIVVYGNAGDVIGYAMRGGKIFIKGDIGYRVGIHMKAYRENVPIIIAGGRAGDFLGEYMAGGILILLGLEDDSIPIAGKYVGTGMHGGVIYIRGDIDQHSLGAEVGIRDIEQEDMDILKKLLGEFSSDMSISLKTIMDKKFVKLIPTTHRPYGRLYAY